MYSYNNSNIYCEYSLFCLDLVVTKNKYATCSV